MGGEELPSKAPLASAAPKNSMSTGSILDKKSIFWAVIGVLIGFSPQFLGLFNNGLSSSAFLQNIIIPFTSRTTPLFECENPVYVSRILNFDPLVIHVENFITEKERKYLINLGEGLYSESRVTLKGGQLALAERRTSTSAFLPREDPVSTCVQRRAADFQGFVPMESMEKLQITRYVKGQEYAQHYDWGLPPDIPSNNRSTTFFGILDSNCTYCGTRFPRISSTWPEDITRPCDFVECDDASLHVKSVPGNAVFWRNLHPNGTGNVDTLHAGLPVTDGFKYGLNIWTKEKGIIVDF